MPLRRPRPALAALAAALAATAAALPAVARADTTSTSTDSPVSINEVTQTPIVVGRSTRITYTIHNTSATQTAIAYGPLGTGPTISTQLPPGMRLTSTAGEQNCIAENRVLNPGTQFSCTMAPLGPGATETLTITGMPGSATGPGGWQTLATVGGYLENDPANPTFAGQNGFAGNVYERTDISSGPTDLQLRGSASSAQPALGSTFSYSLQVRNRGSVDGTDAVIADTLPAGLTPVSGSFGTAGGRCAVSGQAVRCTLGVLPSGATVNATITVKATVAGSYASSATVSSAGGDTNPGDNTVSFATRVR